MQLWPLRFNLPCFTTDNTDEHGLKCKKFMGGAVALPLSYAHHVPSAFGLFALVNIHLVHLLTVLGSYAHLLFVSFAEDRIAAHIRVGAEVHILVLIMV